jgi:hypothetical protein
LLGSKVKVSSRIVLPPSSLNQHSEDRADIDRLLAEVNLGDLDPSQDFEGIVAGLEAAEEVVAAFMRLAARSAHPDLRAAAQVLDDRGVPALVRKLYFAYCAEILDAIGEGARVEVPDAVLTFGGWLRDMYHAHQQMGLFTLNYDVLLERLFVGEDFLGLQRSLTDFFSGWDSRIERVQLADGGQFMLGHHFYPQDPPIRPIHLHHLHGCLTHFRRASDNAVLKFETGSIREDKTYLRLATTKSGDFSPAVILGSRKLNKAREWPFSYAFLELERRALAARTIVLAGYSFRDIAVNDRLRAAAQRGERRWIVINRKSGGEAMAFKEEVDRLVAPAKPEYALAGFGEGLPEPG